MEVPDLWCKEEWDSDPEQIIDLNEQTIKTEQNENDKPKYKLVKITIRGGHPYLHFEIDGKMYCYGIHGVRADYKIVLRCQKQILKSRCYNLSTILPSEFFKQIIRDKPNDVKYNNYPKIFDKSDPRVYDIKNYHINSFDIGKGHKCSGTEIETISTNTQLKIPLNPGISLFKLQKIGFVKDEGTQVNFKYEAPDIYEQKPMIINQLNNDDTSVRGRVINNTAAMKFAKNILTYLGLGIEDKNKMHNKASRIQKDTLQILKLIGMGFDESEKPFGGVLEPFKINEIQALGYTNIEARNMHYSISNGKKSIAVPRPMRKDSFEAPEMAERNNRVRLFLEQDEYSTKSGRKRESHTILGELNVRRRFLKFPKNELYLRLCTETDIEMSIVIFHKLFSIFKHLQPSPQFTKSASCTNCNPKEINEIVMHHADEDFYIGEPSSTEHEKFEPEFENRQRTGKIVKIDKVGGNPHFHCEINGKIHSFGIKGIEANFRISLCCTKTYMNTPCRNLAEILPSEKGREIIKYKTKRLKHDFFPKVLDKSDSRVYDIESYDINSFKIGYGDHKCLGTELSVYYEKNKSAAINSSDEIPECVEKTEPLFDD